MNNLTEYERDMFINLDTLKVNSGWYNIKQDRSDLERFVAAIKKRIDYRNDFEFNESYTKFRRIEVFNYPRNIEYTIEWREDTGEMNKVERNLPEPKFKPYDKKKYAIALGRAD